MSIIYDMASGWTESHPAENNIATVAAEPIPVPTIQELTFDETDKPSVDFSIHLIHALLRNG
jgi:hypothetical protein